MMNMRSQTRTYIDLTQNDIHDAAYNNNEVKNIPRISKITLEERERAGDSAAALWVMWLITVNFLLSMTDAL